VPGRAGGWGGPLSQRGQACAPAPDRRKNIEEEGKESANPRPHGIFTSARGLFGSAPRQAWVRARSASRLSILLVSLLFPRIVLGDFWGRNLAIFQTFGKVALASIRATPQGVVRESSDSLSLLYFCSWSFRSPHNFDTATQALEKGPFEQRGRSGVFSLSPNATRPTVYSRRSPHSNFIR